MRDIPNTSSFFFDASLLPSSPLSATQHLPFFFLLRTIAKIWILSLLTYHFMPISKRQIEQSVYFGGKGLIAVFVLLIFLVFDAKRTVFLVKKVQLWKSSVTCYQYPSRCTQTFSSRNRKRIYFLICLLNALLCWSGQSLVF